MLEAKDISRKFGNVLAVDKVSFTIREGEVFGFLGPNGAGKTTTIRMLTCLISKSGGKITFDGLDADKPKDRTKIRGMIGYLPENPGLYEKLSVYRNLAFYADLHGLEGKQKATQIEKYLKMLGMWEKRGEPVAGFSKGMRQKVAIARALLHEPKYLFFDEPTAGLDPQAAKIVRDFILQIKKKDRVIFLSTHNLDEAQRICDRVGIIKGKLLAIDSPRRLEKSLYTFELIVRLVKRTPKIAKALQNVKGVQSVVQEGHGNSLSIHLISEDFTPVVVKSIISNGGKILSVEPKKHSLEEIYFRLVGKE